MPALIRILGFFLILLITITGFVVFKMPINKIVPKPTNVCQTTLIRDDTNSANFTVDCGFQNFNDDRTIAYLVGRVQKVSQTNGQAYLDLDLGHGLPTRFVLGKTEIGKILVITNNQQLQFPDGINATNKTIVLNTDGLRELGNYAGMYTTLLSTNPTKIFMDRLAQKFDGTQISEEESSYLNYYRRCKSSITNRLENLSNNTPTLSDIYRGYIDSCYLPASVLYVYL